MRDYNAQAVTTEDQVIVAPEIITEGVDFEQLDPMIASADANRLRRRELIDAEWRWPSLPRPSPVFAP